MEKKDWVEEIGNIELEISYTSGVYDLAFLMGYGWYEEVEKIVEQIKQESREEGYKRGREEQQQLDGLICGTTVNPTTTLEEGWKLKDPKELKKELSKLNKKK